MATAASSPSGVVHGARAARSSRRPPDSSDGVLGELDRVSPLSRCGRGGEWQALRTGTAPTDSIRPVLNRTNRRRRTPTEQNQNERCTTQRRTMHEPGNSLEPPFLAFCRLGLHPSSAPRPAPFLAPPSSRRFQKGLEEGACLPLGRVTSCIRQLGEDAPPPPSFHSGDEGRLFRSS